MNEKQRKYVEKLENVVRQLIAPLKDAPPELLLELFSEEKENSLNKENNPKRKKLIRELKKRQK